MRTRLRFKAWRRRPKVTYVVCPRCQRTTVGTWPAPMLPQTGTEAAPSDADRREAAQRLTHHTAGVIIGVDHLRRDLAGDDPVKNRVLGQIEMGFIQTAGDIQRGVLNDDEARRKA